MSKLFERTMNLRCTQKKCTCKFGKCKCLKNEDSTEELLPKNCHVEIPDTLRTPVLNLWGVNFNSAKAVTASLTDSCKFCYYPIFPKGINSYCSQWLKLFLVTVSVSSDNSSSFPSRVVAIAIFLTTRGVRSRVFSAW